LPPHAQNIFRSAFNHAWQTYGGANPDHVEEIAHRVAWATVKKRYRKVGGMWMPRDSPRLSRRRRDMDCANHCGCATREQPISMNRPGANVQLRRD
jgi:cation transport regulator